MQIPNVGAMYRDMARNLGGTLSCEHCGRTLACSDEDASAYLAHGWPKCCGYTMLLVTKAEGERRLKEAQLHGVARRSPDAP